MKYIRMALALLICCMVSGCATVTEEIISDNMISREELGEDASPESAAGEVDAGIEPEKTWTYFEEPVWSSEQSVPTILNTGEEPEIIYRAGEDTHIVSVTGSKDTAYALIAEDSFYKLIAIDREAAVREDDGSQTLEELFPVREIDSFTDSANFHYYMFHLGCYHDTLYFFWSGKDPQTNEWNSGVYAYESGEDSTAQRIEDDAIVTMITELRAQGYEFCGNVNDFMRCLNAYDRMLWWQDSVVYSFDTEGNICDKYVLDSSIKNIRTTDGRYLIGTGGDVYYVYDLENVDDGSVIWDGPVNFFTLSNGSIYYYRQEQYAIYHNHYYFYRYDMDTGEEILLFETEDIPGQPSAVIRNGVSGFSVRGDNCYFLNYDDGSLWWFSCALSGEDHTPVRLGLVQEYRGIFDVGEVVYEHDEYACESCGRVLCAYYIEGIQLSAEVIPCADQINEVLQEIMENEVQAAGKDLESFSEEYQHFSEPQDPEYMCDNNHFSDKDFLESSFKGVTQYVFEREGEEAQYLCLEVDFSSYWDGGGAHGTTDNNTYLFNLNDGSRITLGDICGISEEEFRTLAAEYTVEDYRRNSDLYFHREEEDLYESVYEYVDFNVLMSLSEEGVVISYAPYEFGPYAAGFIPVIIPYEELGIQLVDIYGVNAS